MGRIMVTVKKMNGQEKKYQTSHEEAIKLLIKQVGEAEGQKKEEVALVFAGKQYHSESAETLEEIGVESGSTFFHVMRLNGGIYDQ